MVTPYLPYPLLSGGQIRTYNLLKNLSKHHEITLFALIKDESERQYIDDLKPFLAQIQVFKRTKNPWHPRNILLAAVTPYPFLVTRNLPSSMRSKVAKELATKQYDLIHAETFYMMPNIPHTKIPVLLVEQTIEYLGYRYFAKTTAHWYAKPLLYLDIWKLKFWEQYYWRKASRLVAMSPDDRSLIQSELKESIKIDVVANGVDVERFTNTKRDLPVHPTVLFVGTFKWLPNIDAVTFLVEDIWPQIVNAIPDARLWIVGHSPTTKIKDYARHKSITVSDRVDDIRDAYGAAHVLLAPIRSGKGTRFKVLEAMATGLPVVTTSLGAEGLSLESGKDVLIGNDKQELAELTVRLLNDSSLQVSLAKEAKQRVQHGYSWATISKTLDKVYRELAGKQ